MRESFVEKRIIGWDILRLIAFQAIIYFHFNYLIWFEDVIVAAEKSYFFKVLDFYSRSLSTSGFTIVILSSLLFGLSMKSIKSKTKTIYIVLGGWGLFMIFNYGENEAIFSWDIYPLIALGFSICLLLERYFKSLIYWTGVMGFVSLFLPWTHLLSSIPMSFNMKQVLLGICPSDYADWPIFPWLGLIFFSFFVGYYLRKRVSLFFKIYKWEFFLLPLILTGFVYASANYYFVRPGASFACDIFHFGNLNFFLYLIGIIYLMRLSLLDSVQRFFSSWRIFRLISQSKVSLNFWFAYMFHYFLFYIISGWDSELHDNPNLSAFVILLTLPLAELVIHLSTRWIKIESKSHE